MGEFSMPKMGDGMEEGTITAWLKKEGDVVKKDEPVAEVETDKANVEIASYENGVLSKILVQVGQTVPVGTPIAIIGGAGAATAANGALPAAEPKAKPTASGNGASEPPTPVSAVPTPTEVVTGTGAAERVKTSPLARRIAAERGIDLARVKGTGPNGRIVARDVPETQEAAPVLGIPQLSRTTPVGPSPTLVGQDIEPSKMRRAIANRVLQSKQNIPHFYVTMVIEMDRALALLKELNADAKDGKITVNDIIVKACTVALANVPEVNATWTPDGMIRRYAEAHIGVAVGIEEGLIIPVIRDCQAKTLRQISVEAKALITKARNNQLTPAEYSGGTFSISNLGMMGVDEFIAIINPPEAAILAIGGIVREPVVQEGSDALVIRSRMKITLSSDHRVLDGVLAARFVQEVKKALEAPYTLLS